MQRIVVLVSVLDAVVLVGGFQSSAFLFHQGAGRQQVAPWRTLRVSSSSDAPSHGLYEVQEEMLVKRGIYEETLMAAAGNNGSPLKANKPKGVGGSQKGFGGGGSSNKSRFSDEAKSHAAVLRKEGVVRIDNVLSANLADRMRDFVLALRVDSLEQVAAGTLKNSDRFADVLLKSNRCDLKIPLGYNGSLENPAMEVLQHILCQSAVKDTIAASLTDQAVLYELSCLISDPGSQRQVIHPDNPYLPNREDPTLITCFIALQDVDVSMGPTVYLPRTHTAKAHAAFQDESISPDQTESPKDQLLRASKPLLGTLTKGSCAVYDSRVLHCGSANRSRANTSRAIFYFSFRNPAVAYPGNPASIRSDLAAARLTLQDLTHAVVMAHESKGATNPFAY